MKYRFAQRSEQNMRKHILTIILGAGGGLLLSLYLSVDSAIIQTNSLIAISLGIMISYIIIGLSTFLNRVLPWRSNILIRFILGILIYTVVSFGIIKSVLMIIETSIDGGIHLMLTDEQIDLKLLLILSFSFFLYSIIELLLYSFKSYSTGELEKIKAERKQIDLQLNALKGQLSPHFLFNSLNTASSLMKAESSEAEYYIRKLAKLYEYTINSYSSTLISVQEEVSFIKDYFHLLKTKFGDQIDMNLQISKDHLRTKIPPLALQMCIENAVKHNVVNRDYQLNIMIKSQGRWIDISNNKTKVPAHQTSFKIGLQNIQERYNLLSDKEIKIKNESDFIISIPVIE